MAISNENVKKPPSYDGDCIVCGDRGNQRAHCHMEEPIQAVKQQMAAKSLALDFFDESTDLAVTPSLQRNAERPTFICNVVMATELANFLCRRMPLLLLF